MVLNYLKNLRNTVRFKLSIPQVSQILRNPSVRDFALTAGSNFSIALFSAVGGILAARLLGPGGRGILAAATVWAGILSTLISLGLPQALTYFTAREQDQIGSIFATALVLWGGQSVAALLLGWLAINLFLVPSQPEAIAAVRVYLFSVPCSLLVTYLSTMAQGLRRFRLFNGLRIASASGYMISLVVAFLFKWQEPLKIVIAMLLIQVVIALGAVFLFVAKVHSSGYFTRQWSCNLIKYGLRSYWGNLSWMANARLDQFIMSAFVSLPELGIYSVAVSYATVLFPLSSAFAMVLFPRVANGQDDNVFTKITRTAKLNLVVSLAGALFLGGTCSFVLPWLFGEEFQPAIAPALILLAGTVILGVNYVLSDGLRGLGRPLLPSIAETVGVLVTVLGLLWSLPRMGIWGAAWSSLFSYGMVLFVLIIGIRSSFKEKRSIA